MSELNLDPINWNNLQLLIFDVDGTLYDQSVLRKKMAVALLGYYLIRPWRFKDIFILYHFRKERGERSGYISLDLENEQYAWCALKTNSSLEKVKKVTGKWIFDFPNRYLKQSMYPGVKDIFTKLDEKKILTAVYSDYDPAKKMLAMDLAPVLMVSSTDAHINAFKPRPNGLVYILSELKIQNKANCLFIGDRQELDGKCAEQAGVPFLLVNKETARTDFYGTLLNYLN